MTTESSDQIAFLIIAISMVAAILMILALAGLIIRRRSLERRWNAQRAAERSVSKTMMRHLSDGSDPFEALAGQAQTASIRPMFKLLQILKGADRDLLVGLAHSHGLFAPLLKDLKSISPARRIDAIRQMDCLNHEDIASALLDRLLNDSDLSVRSEAALALARIERLPSPMVLAQALRMHRRSPTHMDRAVMRSAAARNSEMMQYMLGDALPLPMRACIVEALGWSSGLQVVYWLRAEARHSDPAVRLASVKAGKRLGHPALHGALKDALADISPVVRRAAVEACATLGLDGATGWAALAHDPDWMVRTIVNRMMPKPCAEEG